MDDPITREVEGLFDDIDSVEMRARFRRKSKKLTSRCPTCNGKGERWERLNDEHGYWYPCDTCHPEKP